MKHAMTLAALAMGGAATLGAGEAEAQVAISGSIGTTGGTAEAQVRVMPGVHLRGGYNYFQYEVEDTYDDIAYTGDLDLSTAGAFVDVHPFGNSFFLSAGAYIGGKTLDLGATPSGTVEIGGETYTSAEVGTLNLQADLEDTAPFVGLGWDTTFENPGLGLRFLVGAMFTGSPEVDLSSTGGTLSGNQAFQDQLAVEEATLQDEIKDFEVYPVVQLGLSWSF